MGELFSQLPADDFNVSDEVEAALRAESRRINFEKQCLQDFWLTELSSCLEARRIAKPDSA